MLRNCPFSPGGLVGHRAFFRFEFQDRAGLYGAVGSPIRDKRGASHDAIEQDFHDPDAAADHFCAGCGGYHEGDKLALRF
jgi:hypothetical protein